ncbi:uncharacterized protein V1513DRAFT_306122 [Lipomyces chichibuensis]|uniref:uncharacterized protein n=1 Tax=Lipomyces chichibuensis TaxID=1546026 RepID=UPI003343C958
MSIRRIARVFACALLIGMGFMTVRVSAVETETRTFELINGTLITVPGREIIRSNFRNSTFMSQLMRNMSLVDHDMVSRGQRMVFTVQYNNGILDSKSADIGSANSAIYKPNKDTDSDTVLKPSDDSVAGMQKRSTILSLQQF